MIYRFYRIQFLDRGINRELRKLYLQFSQIKLSEIEKNEPKEPIATEHDGLSEKKKTQLDSEHDGLSEKKETQLDSEHDGLSEKKETQLDSEHSVQFEQVNQRDFLSNNAIHPTLRFQDQNLYISSLIPTVIQRNSTFNLGMVRSLHLDEVQNLEQILNYQLPNLQRFYIQSPQSTRGFTLHNLLQLTFKLLFISCANKSFINQFCIFTERFQCLKQLIVKNSSFSRKACKNLVKAQGSGFVLLKMLQIQLLDDQNLIELSKLKGTQFREINFSGKINYSLRGLRHIFRIYTKTPFLLTIGPPERQYTIQMGQNGLMFQESEEMTQIIQYPPIHMS